MTTILPNLFATQTAPLLANLDANFTNVAGGLVIPCNTTGSTGTVVALTPAQASSGLVITGYSNSPIFSFICLITSTGPVSVNVSNNGALPLYASDGVTQITTGGLVALANYVIQLDGALNSGAGGFVILSSSPNGVTAGSYTNPTITVGPDGRLTSVSAGVPSVGAGFFKNLRIYNNPSVANTQVNISAAVVIAATSSFQNSVALTYLSATIDLTVGTSASQVNGMDGETRPTSTFAFIYAISTASGPAGLASTSSLVPTLPPGVTQFTRIGAVCLDSSSNLFRTIQMNRRTQYTLTSGTNTQTVPLLASGSVGSISTPTYVAVSTLSFAPTTAARIQGFTGATSNIAIVVAPNGSYGPYNSATSPPPVVLNPSAGNFVSPFDFALESTSIYWANNGSTGFIYVLGWEDNL